MTPEERINKIISNIEDSGAISGAYDSSHFLETDIKFIIDNQNSFGTITVKFPSQIIVAGDATTELVDTQVDFISEFNTYWSQIVFKLFNEKDPTFSAYLTVFIDYYFSRFTPEVRNKIVLFSIEKDNALGIPLLSLIKDNYSLSIFTDRITELMRTYLSVPRRSAYAASLIKATGGITSNGGDADLANNFYGFNGPVSSLPTESYEEDIVQYAQTITNIESEKIKLDWVKYPSSRIFNFFFGDKDEISLSQKIKNGYTDYFVAEVIRDDRDLIDGERGESTLQQKFDSAITNTIEGVNGLNSRDYDLEDRTNFSTIGLYQIFMIFLENERRQFLIDNFNRDLLKRDAAGTTTAEKIDELEKKAINDFADADLFEEEEDPELSEEDIKNRQRFFKQCALMMNLPKLAKSYNNIIQQRIQNRVTANSNPTTVTCQTLTNKFNKAPFDKRLYMVSNSNDQSATLSKMLNSDVAKELFNIPPAVLSSLTPKIKLYRVQNEDDKPIKTEFVFDSSEDLNRERNFVKPTNFLDMPFDKGSGVGLKEFSFEFNGTNPAESRKDIQAVLRMHFQSFADFIAERKSYNGQKYRFVDLILHPDKVQKELLHKDQYSPSYYRIMAEVGYHIPEASELAKMFPWYAQQDLQSISTNNNPAQSNNKTKPATERLVEALERTNKVFYLCMIDHDFQINVDGTIDLTVNYGAYVETILKTHQYDALATPELVERRKQNLDAYLKVLNNNNCTQDELQRVLAGLDAQDAVIRERALQSIITRLLQRDKIFICQITEAQAAAYRTLGFFRNKPELKGLSSQSTEPTQQDSVTPGQENGATDIILNQTFMPEDYNYNAPGDNTIQYFFFGDLLHTILDTMYKRENPSVLRPEVESCRFILGSFDFDVYKDAGNLNSTVNIAQIPISVEYFADWFQNNVIKKGQTRKSFPIITFIRNLSSNLLQQSLLESCINRRIDKNFSFQTGQLTAYNKGGDPLGEVFNKDNQPPVIEVNNYRGSDKILPFKGDTTSEMKDISGYHNYMYLGVLGSSLSTRGNGNYIEDNRNGIYHIEIGNNKGIVKSVSFAKTDMQFVREARFFQQGVDGLLQLSTVYKVTIEMFGNTIFYPGMDLFLNPYGIGRIGSPTKGGSDPSLANKLGLGGYHTVTNVKSSIGVNGFKTTIQAQLYYTGDGSSSRVIGSPNGQTVQNITGSNAPQKNKTSVSCEPIVQAVEDDLSNLEKNKSSSYFVDIAQVTHASRNTQRAATNSTSATGTTTVPAPGTNTTASTGAGAQAPPAGTAGISTSQDELDELDAMLAEMEASGTSTQSTPPAPTTTPETPTTTPAGDEQTTTPPASGTQPTEAPAEAAAPAEETPAETPEPEPAAEENLQVPISDQEQAEAALFDELLPIAEKFYEEIPGEDDFAEMKRLAELNKTYNTKRVDYNKSVFKSVNGVQVEFAEIYINYTDGTPAVYARKRK